MSKAVRKGVLLALLIFSSLAFTSTLTTDTLTEIITKITNHHDQRPQEKLYVQLDKPFYAAGETIWFKTYLVDAKLHAPDSAISKVLYVELLNTRKELLVRHMLYSPAGISYGDFKLDETLPQGKYMIRAYTNYMKNMNSDFFFYKEFQLFSAVEKEVDLLEDGDSIDVQFFPEGGNLLAGVENRVAFKSINSFGKAIAVEGQIFDSQNNSVATFKTDHSGMGSFKLFAASGKKYTAQVKESVGINTMFPLPSVMDNGYMLQVTDAGDNLRVYIYSNIHNSPGPVLFNLVGQTRGEVYYAAKSEIKNTALTTTISKKKFPTGIAHLTLFDGKGRPQCERLVFINHQDTLNFTIKPDKDIYTKREKVTMDLMVQDKTGQPVLGNFSISVFDPAGIENEANYPLTIENYLLLTSDLKGFIEEPGYYLKDESPETVRHLDLLMLTHGWRRFTWKTILKNPLTTVNYFAERGITISGTIIRALSDKPAKFSKLKIFTEQGDLLITQSDSIGRFYSDDLFFFDNSKIAIQTDNAKGKQAPLQFKLDPFNVPPIVEYTLVQQEALSAEHFLYLHGQQSKILDFNSATLLKEIEVRSSKLERPSRAKLYGTPSASIKMSDIPGAHMSILQAIQSRVPGVKVVGTPPNMSLRMFRGYGDPLYLINGTPVDMDAIMSLQPLDVESIDILKGTAAAAYGNRAIGGVVAVYTKPGASFTRPSVGMQHIKYPGFYTAREFYSPKYDSPDMNDLPDLRSTQYWNPYVETDENGKAQISFYTSDVLSTYRVVIEGVSYTGRPGHYTAELNVK